MARKSKSSKSNENSDAPEELEAVESASLDPDEPGESSSDGPVVIEAEAVEVTETEIEIDETPAEPDPIEAEAEVIAEEEDKVDQPVVSDPVPQTSSETSGGASVLALIFGGIVAGAIGYFGANLVPKETFDATELSESISQNASALANITADVEALKSAPAPELPDVEGQLTTLAQSIDALSGDLSQLQSGLSDTRDAFNSTVSDLDARLLALETAVPSAGALASGDELAALRARITEMTEDAQSRLADAQQEAAEISRAAEEARIAAEAEAAALREEAAAREAELQAMAERQAKILDLKSAVENGAGFEELIQGIGDVPEVLQANAETGVPTVQDLKSSFPEVARLALAQSETVPDDASAGERMIAFLNRRTNARSLTPQEGDGPDAVLSRAEALLSDGDLPSAIAELDALPDGGKAALADWLAQANTRLEALDAVRQLSATN